MKEIKQAFEFLIFISLLKIVSVFTFNQTSKIGSFLVGFFGRYSRYQEQLIINNLQQMGRVFFEFLNLDKFNWKNLEVKNNFNFEKIMNYEGPRIFISAHIGNWEITRNHLLNQGFTLHSVYRQANNSKIDKFIQIKRYKKNAFFL